MLPTRRSLLTAFLAVPALPVCNRAAAQQPTLPLTPACRDDDDLTPALTAGPFYKPDAPLRHDLSGDAPDGERITIAGYVLDGNCRPIARSLVEIWHADETGAYDTRGYRLRGHQVTDERGRWWFSTIIPALYPGRTRHYHFRVRRPGAPVLTTQLFFPNEPQNDGDRLYSPSLLLDLRDTEDGKFGRFDFVV
ncbi:intradiol ring-cleavage dioxygenase [Sinorhizobium medicae]|uniref:Intradiol ring-cleavage dioxygenase n=2 Tax=Sinorhizobium medicae TaxID=110321 RepID=A0A6G1WHW5_9HYPH|nr:intradiol ring-cleavage dioxygenase [Sinorhizobium medicae]ABR62877.1 intradiol ring-cleavage dioxygenase [Sinorhizobium medicae WSM419]MBO1942569.1 intradiol ring-cleavage dioxygenase [Sinorhizobium medicae]MDX0403369.1 intradiol ring-cleavage dioxygenase [Sinorhizobium medicae]MDX0409625.1 intradiol ring-cleavage dioxygenase [Sinorhizobium medicae]MDX0415742.1 intradiol ring-cleavage dioxygenase [Sinorhizobium medicae]